MRKVLLLSLMLMLVLGSLYQILQQRQPVVVSDEVIAGIPADRYVVPGRRGGVVIVAHGLSSSKEMMRSWGYALAREGLEVYVIDQPGHGQNPGGFDQWVASGEDGLGDHIRRMVEQLIRDGRAEPGRIGLVGHSMGGAAVTAAALTDDRVAATVTISSSFRGALPPDRPANLLALAAERDPAFMVAAVEALARASDADGQLGVRYGRFEDGSARQAAVVAGRNHITIIFDPDVMQQAAAWFHTAFGSAGPGTQPYAIPWRWVVAALLGAFGVVLVVAAMLAPRTDSRGWPQNEARMGALTGLITLVVAAFSAVLGTVYIRFPWLGVAVADYVLPYFLLMTGILILLRLLWPRDFGFPILQTNESLLEGLLRGAGVFLGFLGAMGTVIHMNLSNYMPTSARLAPMAIMVVLLWLYFAQEEALKKAVTAGGGPWAALLVGLGGKLAVAATWFAASALPNPQPFLPLTIPVVLVFMVVLEVLAAVLRQWRYPPVATATVLALAFGWTMAVSFPLM